MPKPNATKSPSKIVYPSGVKELNEDLSTDDLVRRLKDCAQAFQNMSQDDDNSIYIPLALYLGSDFFLEHPRKDVRLIIACSIADVFRVFAPEAPYKDPEQLKVIFEFFIQQLRGLEDPKDPIFKRYFYLLENLAWVKSFNICIELEDNQSIFCQLFTLIFNIVNDNHSTKVKNFMMDMMCPLISEADSVSQELLDIILAQIIEPRKTQNKNAYNLAKDILRRTCSTIEPYLQAFFNNALILGKTSRSDVGHHLYDLIYELNSICPSMLVAVLPQLEFKLKSNEEKERLEVSRLLARMFSDKNSDLAAQNKPLWNCFLGRYNDISMQVRMRCVQYSMHFLLNHPELSQDITEQLRHRQHDPEETVRYEVVMAIISAAKKDFNSVSEELLNFVKERTLDKKFKIRKEALLGLALLYKQNMSNPDLPESALNCISWIKNKVLHGYYQASLEDRLLVERILYTCLVPYQSEDRMKKLYQLFATVDDNAVKAFNELLKCQNIVRNQLCNIIETLQQPKSEEREKNLCGKIVIISKNLSEPIKSQEYIRKFCTLVENSQQLHNHINVILKGNAACSEVEHSVKEILKSVGPPVQMNSFYMTIKQLLERVAPVMIDHSGIKQLIFYVTNSLLKGEEIAKHSSVENSAHRGLQLLHTLSYVYPGSFHGEEIFNELLNFFCANDERAAELTLQILTNIGESVEKKYPNIAQRLLPLLKNFVQNGSVKQAKYAVACINTAVSNKEQIFGEILEHLKQHLSLTSGYFRTALVSVGHIAFRCSDLFGPQIKSIVSKVIVKELLMMDLEPSRQGDALWVSYDELPEETKVKIEGMKVMVRWLLGLKTAVPSATSTLRLLTSVILHQGDLMEKGHVSPMEKSWLRFMAASCILKLCQEPLYAEAMTLEQFQTLAFVINDECSDVREKFASKLHKGLLSLKLPLDFLAIFSLCGTEKLKELKCLFKQYLITNITKRRDYLKQHLITTRKLFTILPDYVLPYAIHLLSHEPSFKKYDDVASLNRIKECLWFLMEPLMTKNENYSFSFFKRLIENIKQTKDKQASDDDLANLKLYAVCDLALGLVISKTTNFVLKDFPVEPSLPSKLFTNLDKTYSNIKTYLPQELAFTPPKKSGIEMEMFGLTTKGTNRTAFYNKKEGKPLLNGEATNKELLVEEKDNKSEKENKAIKETKKQNLNDGNQSSKQLAKRSPGRPRKIQITDKSKLFYKTTSLSNNSNSSIVKRPRGRPPGRKNSNIKKKDENECKQIISVDETKEQTDNYINPTELQSQKKPSYLEDKNIDSNSPTNSNSSTSKKIIPLKRPRGRPKKLPINTNDEFDNEVSSSITEENPSVSTVNNNRSQQKRKLNNSKSSSNEDLFDINKNMNNKKETTALLNTSVGNLSNDDLSNVSIYYDTSPRKLSIVVDKLATDRYCKLNIKESQIKENEDRLKSVNNSSKKSEKSFQQESITKNSFSTSIENNNESNLSNISSPGINKILNSTPMTRTARKSFVDKRYSLKSMSHFTVEDKSNKYCIGKGKTLSPTIISVCASPQKSPALSNSSIVHSSDSLQTDLEDNLLNTNNIKSYNLFQLSPEKLQSSEGSESSLSNISPSSNKSKKKIGNQSNAIQKENSFMKHHQNLNHPFKSSNKILSNSRIKSTKRPDLITPNSKSNSHNLPVRQSERLSAAAKASRKRKMRKSQDDDLIFQKTRSPLLSPNRQTGTQRYKKTKTEKSSIGNKDINLLSRKNTTASLLSRAIRSSSLTARTIKSNNQRSTKQK